MKPVCHLPANVLSVPTFQIIYNSKSEKENQHEQSSAERVQRYVCSPHRCWCIYYQDFAQRTASKGAIKGIE